MEVFMLGLKSGTVRIEKYNPEWKNKFEKEQIRLESALKEYNVNIQHVGSTSIIGCSAKPIIDIAIGVESLEYGEKLIAVLEKIGYIYDGDGKIPGRHFFKKGNGELRTHYIHLEPINGELWSNHILYRDYLNNHFELVKEYSNLKESLESEFADNRDGYARKKDPFIENILGKAKEEKCKDVH
jgi:GrpB-like predicted nucleotidyltransferase (UPF0157 family)